MHRSGWRKEIASVTHMEELKTRGLDQGTKKANTTSIAPSKWETTLTVGEVTHNGPRHEGNHVKRNKKLTNPAKKTNSQQKQGQKKQNN